MNILVLASEYPYEKDKNADRTKVVGYFAKEWVKQGHKVIAIVDSSAFPAFYYSISDKIKGIVAKLFGISRAPNRLWTKRFAYDEHGVHVENIPIVKYVPHGRFSKMALQRQLNEIMKVLERNDFVPDVVTGHWVNPQIMLIPDLARKYKAKSAFVFHADYSEKICRKFDVQQFIDQIDHICFRSQSAAESAKKYLHFKDEPFIAASGVPDAFVEKYKEVPVRKYAESRLRIITAARLVEYKKIDSIISASAKAFSNHAFELTIAGDGPLKSQLESQTQKYGMSEDIHFIGRISRDGLQEQMRKSDVFVLISKRETFGLVYLEAMLQGCIVIASRFGGADGIIKDGENGFLCEEGNEEELARIFNRIRNMRCEKKNEISKQAVATARKYTEQNVAENYLNWICK